MSGIMGHCQGSLSREEQTVKANDKRIQRHEAAIADLLKRKEAIAGDKSKFGNERDNMLDQVNAQIQGERKAISDLTEANTLLRGKANNAVMKRQEDQLQDARNYNESFRGKIQQSEDEKAKELKIWENFNRDRQVQVEDSLKLSHKQRMDTLEYDPEFLSRKNENPSLTLNAFRKEVEAAYQENLKKEREFKEKAMSQHIEQHGDYRKSVLPNLNKIEANS